MLYYVYIIESLLDGDLYKGVTENISQRLEQHNNGELKFTSTNTDYSIIK
jgi:putative endonuclease